MKIQFIINELPPPLNQCYKPRKYGGGIYLTKKAKDWKTYAGYSAKNIMSLNKLDLIEGNIRMKVMIYYKYNRDIDATSKLLLDSLENVVYRNVKKIVDLHIKKM